MAIHYANVGFFHVDAVGIVRKKSDSSTTVGQMMTGSSEHRVIEDPTIPNTIGYPTVRQYLEAEDASGFTLSHMDQTTIITYG